MINKFAAAVICTFLKQLYCICTYYLCVVFQISGSLSPLIFNALKDLFYFSLVMYVSCVDNMWIQSYHN